MKPIGKLASVVALTVFALTAQAAEITRQVPVTKDFVEGEIGWRTGGRMFVYRIELIVVGGVIEFCGAVAYEQSRRESKQFLRDSALEINGRKVIRDLSYWTPVRTAGQLVGSMANCRSTGVSASEQISDISIAWSRKALRD